MPEPQQNPLIYVFPFLEPLLTPTSEKDYSGQYICGTLIDITCAHIPSELSRVRNKVLTIMTSSGIRLSIGATLDYFCVCVWELGGGQLRERTSSYLKRYEM